MKLIEKFKSNDSIGKIKKKYGDYENIESRII